MRLLTLFMGEYNDESSEWTAGPAWCYPVALAGTAVTAVRYISNKIAAEKHDMKYDPQI